MDSDVAKIYGVTTKEVNQAVSNNSEKFPKGCVFELTEEEKSEVVDKNGELVTQLFDDDLKISDTETSIEFNLGR